MRKKLKFLNQGSDYIVVGLQSPLLVSFMLLLGESLLFLATTDIGQVKQLESVPDLEKLMYMVVDGYPCVRLLSLSGEIGCSSKKSKPDIALNPNFAQAINSDIAPVLITLMNLFTQILDVTKLLLRL
ncbi:unnamed protein product [Ilex paraguariensis]|uniref:Uncharacterized protein n=1 Tax=Ilex paraguariensis TaxID=185542 RepID=A0ABC8T3Y6_9AQUA